jgi:hypothetical protein
MPYRSVPRPLIVPVLALGLALSAGVPAARAQDATPQPLAIGSALPMADVAMQGVDGKSHTIASVRGTKGTLVIFACNHCPFVKAWEERMVALGNRWPAQGVGVIAVNANDPEAYPEDDLAGMKERAKQRGMKYAYVMDGTSDVARAFGATRTPEAFLFDASGKLVYHGAIDDNAHEPAQVKVRYLEDALVATASGKPVPVADTKSIGCSIKYRAKA